ncbi:hypothetical protein CF168_09340 [Shewanella bicestrii]|uniref:Uncharacterized protein n=1 Tax=Shewanella bicestrii TaxID=2018305 RepID=A0A220UM75_9GAMM|nr:hypothetical protein CF168_09340 [Shewanella bicestrii]
MPQSNYVADKFDIHHKLIKLSLSEVFLIKKTNVNLNTKLWDTDLKRITQAHFVWLMPAVCQSLRHKNQRIGAVTAKIFHAQTKIKIETQQDFNHD